MLQWPHQQEKTSLRPCVCAFKFLPFYASLCSPSFPARGMPEKRWCCWIRSMALNLAKRQTALNTSADRSVLWDLAVGIGPGLSFGKMPETCVCKMQFTVSETVGLKFFLSPPCATFHYVRNNQNMTSGIFSLSETQYGFWSTTQCY